MTASRDSNGVLRRVISSRRELAVHEKPRRKMLGGAPSSRRARGSDRSRKPRRMSQGSTARNTRSDREMPAAGGEEEEGIDHGRKGIPADVSVSDAQGNYDQRELAQGREVQRGDEADAVSRARGGRAP
jgi:hypothetical protein